MGVLGPAPCSAAPLRAQPLRPVRRRVPEGSPGRDRRVPGTQRDRPGLENTGEELGKGAAPGPRGGSAGKHWGREQRAPGGAATSPPGCGQGVRGAACPPPPPLPRPQQGTEGDVVRGAAARGGGELPTLPKVPAAPPPRRGCGSAAPAGDGDWGRGGARRRLPRCGLRGGGGGGRGWCRPRGRGDGRRGAAAGSGGGGGGGGRSAGPSCAP